MVMYEFIKMSIILGLQVGSDIDGEAANDFSGYSVSLSSDGSVVAIGAPVNDGNGNNSGHVRIYKNVNNTWIKVGSDIDGEAAFDQLGISVSLSSDGSLVAIAAPFNDGSGTDSGHVRIYKNVNNIWTKIGEDIDGEAAGDYSGYSISLSGNGSSIAIGASSNNGNGNNSGHVRVYQVNSITLTSQSISASELISLDSQYSGTVNASSVNTITGTASDVESLYNSSGITGLGNEDINLFYSYPTAALLKRLDNDTSGTINAQLLPQ